MFLNNNVFSYVKAGDRRTDTCVSNGRRNIDVVILSRVLSRSSDNDVYTSDRRIIGLGHVSTCSQIL